MRHENQNGSSIPLKSFPGQRILHTNDRKNLKKPTLWLFCCILLLEVAQIFNFSAIYDQCPNDWYLLCMTGTLALTMDRDVLMLWSILFDCKRGVFSI